MGQKDKKAKAAEKKARVAAKENKKAVKKEKKGKTRGKEGSDAEGDEDLETVLEDYAKKQAQFLKVTETSCEPPSPRSSATLVGSPANAKEIFLFGGEYFNGALATFYNDLYCYNIDRDEWRIITSPNSPLPRSGHAWCRGGNAGGVYLFGGEFSSPKQGTFYHYNDFWRLDPSTREWSKIESKTKSPPARSGHRMTYYKNFIILFGGFQDTSQQTKYLQDLWIYDCQNFIWHNPVLPQKPDARSSFSLLPHETGAVLYGGYSRVKTGVSAGGKNKAVNQSSKAVMKPMVHQDAWFLRFSLPAPGAAATAPPAVRWERRKRPTNAPNPPRAGATQAYHIGRGIMFGGVHDVEESEEGIDSEFFNDLFVWNIERNRFYPAGLRKARTAPKKQTEDRDKRGKAKADEAKLLRNLAALETSGNIQDAENIDLDLPEQAKEPIKVEKPVLNAFPHARFNAQLAVQGDSLYIFGGTYEQGDREYTFAEMHAVDLGKLDGVKEIYRYELENWQEENESEDDSDEEDDSEDEDDNGDGPSGVPLPPSSETGPPNDMEEPIEEEGDATESTISSSFDDRPHPRPFESLRDFFARTSQAWQDFILSKAAAQSESADPIIPGQSSVKELRKTAFESAEAAWWDCREEILAEEERQEEAGIGEVISLAKRGTEAGSGGSRRR